MSNSFLGYKIGWKTIIAIVLGVAAFVLISVLLSGCDGKTDSGRGQPVQPDDVLFCPPPEMQAKTKNWGSYPHVYQTPKGVMVYSGVEVPKQALDALDRAAEFSVYVQKAQFPEWQRWLTLPEYEIWFVEADGIAPQAQLPFVTRGGHMTAGTVAYCPNTTRKQRTPAFLPDFRLVNWEKMDALEEYAFNEWEHSREIQNDPAIAALFFGAGDQHPHKHEGKPTASDLRPKTLLARQAQSLACGFGR